MLTIPCEISQVNRYDNREGKRKKKKEKNIARNIRVTRHYHNRFLLLMSHMLRIHSAIYLGCWEDFLHIVHGLVGVHELLVLVPVCDSKSGWIE